MCVYIYMYISYKKKYEQSIEGNILFKNAKNYLTASASLPA